MATPPSFEQLNRHVSQLEAQKRKKKQRLTLTISVGLCLLIGTGFWGWQMAQPTPQPFVPPPYLSAEILTLEQVQQQVQEAPFFLVNKTDTVWIANTRTYLEWVAHQAPQVEVAAPPAIPQMTIAVAGEKVVGEPLVYTISPYDPSISLVLDFGNGVQRPVRRAETTYSYPLPGHFEMILGLAQTDSIVQLDTLMYQIRPAEEAIPVVDQPILTQGDSERNSR